MSGASNSRKVNFEILINDIAIEEGFKDYEIISIEQGFTGNNYSGDVSRTEIRPSDGAKSLHIITKTANGSKDLRQVMPLRDFYKNETYAYTTVLPGIVKILEENGVSSIQYAKFYKSIPDEFKEAIIMQDMCHDGYAVHDRRKPFDQEQIGTVFKTLAKLHAASFIIKEKDPKSFKGLSENFPHSNNYGVAMTRLFKTLLLTRTSAIDCPESRYKIDQFGSIAEETLNNVLNSKSTEPYNVICHGDCGINNMLFKYQGQHLVDVLLIDWQSIRIATPATDLGYALFMTMDADDLEGLLDNLLDLYYSTLRDCLSMAGCDASQCYPKEKFNKHVQSSLIFGFIIAMCSIPMFLSDPKDAKNVEEIMNETNDSENVNIPMNEIAKLRINNLVKYFVNHGII